MIGIHQTRVSPTDGDCAEACFASVFECAIEDVPPQPEGEGLVDDWIIGGLRPWLRERGFDLLILGIASHEKFRQYVPTTYWFAGIPSKAWPELCNHLVVMRGADLAWNPEPGGFDELDFSSIEVGWFLVPVDPVEEAA